MDHEILRKKVNDLQNEFHNRLYHQQNIGPTNPNTPRLLKLIQDTSNEVLDYAFGEFGKNLSALTHTLDMNHPDLNSIFDGIFDDNSEFSKQCLEFLSLAYYAKQNGTMHLFPMMGILFLKNALDKNIIKRIEVINCAKCYVRMVEDEYDRESIRQSKRMQVIDLQSFYKKGEESWNSQNDNFTQFLRYDSAYVHELKQAEKKMNRYQELGCSSLASEIKKSIDIFRENMEQSYYGFNRITMTNAAITLAKSMGYSYKPSYNLFAGSQNVKVDANIIINRTYFGNFYFDPTLYVDASYFYEPKVYPFHELKDVASDEVNSVIKFLEHFPEANNKPIFDHFGVIVPSIAYKNNLFKNDNDEVMDFATVDECQIELDKVMIKKKLFHPVIVGEKDGKCFFICYWT